MDKATIPNNCKLADITPAHKHGNKMDKGNYRPVSILPAMSKFFESVYARWLQINNQEGIVPEDGYHGEYLIETAKTISKSIGYDQNTQENIVQVIGNEGLKITIEKIKDELADLGIEFDNWFSEKVFMKMVNTKQY